MQDAKADEMPHMPVCLKCRKNVARVVFSECGDICCCISCALKFDAPIECPVPECRQKITSGVILK
jgi:hypothetical protein